MTADAETVAVDAVYLRRLKEAQESIKVELCMVTPTWAQNVLDTANTHNRRLSTTWVKIQSAIVRGNWHVNGESIVFDRDGRLINGQHRLRAVVAADVPVPVIVVYGVDPDAFVTFDQGKKRSQSDVLSIVGYDDPTMLAPTLAWQWRYECGRIESGLTPGNDEVSKIAAGHPEILKSAAWSRQRRQKLVPPALLAFIHYQLTGIDTEGAETFFDRVIEGVDVQKGSHEFLLRRRLEDLEGVRDAKTQVEICALIFKTWNRVRSGEQPGKMLVWNSDTERFPDIR